MKRYLLTIETEKERIWKKFTKTYKNKSLGTNLGEAILKLIEKENMKVQ